MRPGYKQTELGLIPEQWEVKRISDFASVGSGGTPSRAVAAYWNGSIPWITTSQIDFEIICDADQFITDEGLKNSAAKFLPVGTILIALYGQGKTRGKVGVLGIAAATNQACASITLQDGVSREFILHFLASKYEDIRSSSNSGGQENLSGRIVKRLHVAFPELQEQCAIAFLLNDMDALLAGLDRLIAKKRDLKQAAMQQLLTGQTRLPGFRGEWEVKTLGELADVKTGPFGSSLHESDYVPDGTPIITVEHLGEFGVEHFNLPMVSGFDRRRLQAYSLQAGDIVFSRVGSVDRNALIRTSEAGWLFSGRLLRVRPDQQRAYAPFLSYQFHSEPFKALVRSVAVGQTMASLNTQILKGTKVRFPPLREQTAIASALSDIDTELTTLQARRDKTHALKQGMMQELLTGRTRLV